MCVAAEDCVSGVCTGDSCVAPACDDGVLNGDETDMDCGGSCTACDAGGMCVAPADCLSSVCTGESCIAPACNDGVLNGDETDMDCGGGSCEPCVRGDSCVTNADCLDSVCYSPAGTATCERVTFIRGTTVAVDPVMDFPANLIRVDFTAPPTVIGPDGTPFLLPTRVGGTFIQGAIIPAVASATVIVAGTTLVNPTGAISYQTIANDDYYGVLVRVSGSSTANFTSLVEAGLESTDVEIVVVDTSP